MTIFWIIGLVIGYFSQETFPLRMLKVSIPSYKMRGEIAVLECHYQLGNRRDKTTHSHFDKNHDNEDDEESRVAASSRYHSGIINRAYNETERHERYKNYFLNNEDDDGDDEDGGEFLDGRRNFNHYRDKDGDEEEALYSVKWYRDHEEFYRFVPKDNPPQHSYSVEGIKVDHKMSNDRRVVLRPVTLKSRGLYRCEVSAEAPSFATVHAENLMEVVYLPTHNPKIVGGENLYKSGDSLNLTCISGKSYPGSKLNWLINNKTITDAKIVKNYREIHHTHGLITTMLSLEFIINGRYFEDEGALRVKCVATISPVIWQQQQHYRDGSSSSSSSSSGGGGNNRESVLQWKPPPLIDNREAMFLVRGSASRHIPCKVRLFSIPLVAAVFTTLLASVGNF